MHMYMRACARILIRRIFDEKKKQKKTITIIEYNVLRFSRRDFIRGKAFAQKRFAKKSAKFRRHYSDAKGYISSFATPTDSAAVRREWIIARKLCVAARKRHLTGRERGSRQ